MITAAAAVVEDSQGRLLICQKGAESSSPFLWEFPGGKVEPHETPKECLRRELWEELGVAASPGAFVGEEWGGGPGLSVRVLFYQTEITGGEPRKTEHFQLLWAGLESLRSFQFTPPDRLLAEKLMAAGGAGSLKKNGSFENFAAML
jgi:8-oxo-dGTP diphosphatase